VFSDIASSSEASSSQQEHAQHSIKTSQKLHAIRTGADTKEIAGTSTTPAPDAEDGLFRKIYTSQKTAKLRKKLLYSEGGDLTTLEADESAKEVLEYFGKTFEFYKEVFERDGIDGENLQMIGSLHYDDIPGPPGMDNAFVSNMPSCSFRRSRTPDLSCFLPQHVPEYQS